MGKKRKRPPRIKEKVEMRTKEERKVEAHKIIKSLPINGSAERIMFTTSPHHHIQ